MSLLEILASILLGLCIGLAVGAGLLLLWLRR